MLNALIILTVVLITSLQLQRSLSTGIAVAVFFLVLLPTEMRFQTPGALPELTVHRILLLLCAMHAMAYRSRHGIRANLPLIPLLLLVTATRCISMFNAVSAVYSIKDLASFLLEVFLFYSIMGTVLQDRETIMKVLWSTLAALLAVSLIAAFEKYTGVNPAARVVPNMIDYGGTVSSTFRIRILLGYAMAMGFPIAAALWIGAVSRKGKTVAALASLMLPAACYFANSRGPWVGLALGAAVLGWGGGRAIRRRMVLLSVFGALLFLIRPGVAETITRRWQHSINDETLKGKTAAYRLELWTVAYKKVGQSFERALFGYGGGSTEMMQLDDDFQYGGSSRALGYTSWDGEFPADLVKYGFVGLLAEFLLYGIALKLAYDAWRQASDPHKILLSACMATMMVFIWAMTNVAIFNPQLVYLFWAVTAVAIRLPATARVSPEEAESAPKTLPETESLWRQHANAQFLYRETPMGRGL